MKSEEDVVSKFQQSWHLNTQASYHEPEVKDCAVQWLSERVTGATSEYVTNICQRYDVKLTVAHSRRHLEVLDNVDRVLLQAMPVCVRQGALDQDPATDRTLKNGALNEEDLNLFELQHPGIDLPGMLWC